MPVSNYATESFIANKAALRRRGCINNLNALEFQGTTSRRHYLPAIKLAEISKTNDRVSPETDISISHLVASNGLEIYHRNYGSRLRKPDPANWRALLHLCNFQMFSVISLMRLPPR